MFSSSRQVQIPTGSDPNRFRSQQVQIPVFRSQQVQIPVGLDPSDSPTERIIILRITSVRITSERINTERITSERITSERIKLPNV